MQTFILIIAISSLLNFSLYAYNNDEWGNSRPFLIEDEEFFIEEDDESFSSIEENVASYKRFSLEELSDIISDDSISNEFEKSLNSQILSFYSDAKELENMYPFYLNDNSIIHDSEYKRLVGSLEHHEKGVLELFDSQSLSKETMELKDSKMSIKIHLKCVRDLLAEMFCDQGVNNS
ncbi:MAG: hypothetical protein AB8G05_01835 [Oligoflexales bacterium]